MITSLSEIHVFININVCIYLYTSTHFKLNTLYKQTVGADYKQRTMTLKV